MSFASRVWQWPLVLAGSFTLGVVCIVAAGDERPALLLIGEAVVAAGALALPVVFARSWRLRQTRKRQLQEQSEVRSKPTSA